MDHVEYLKQIASAKKRADHVVAYFMAEHNREERKNISAGSMRGYFPSLTVTHNAADNTIIFDYNDRHEEEKDLTLEQIAKKLCSGMPLQKVSTKRNHYSEPGAKFIYSIKLDDALIDALIEKEKSKKLDGVQEALNLSYEEWGNISKPAREMIEKIAYNKASLQVTGQSPEQNTQVG